MTLSLFAPDGHWHAVGRADARARLLADRHYSRQTPGAREFMANGRTLVLLSTDASAVWGVIENLDPAGGHRWRCSIFRNEGDVRSRRSHYRGLPSVGLTTEVDPERTARRRSRRHAPGHCFIAAGWTPRPELARGLVVLDAPPPAFTRGTMEE